MSNIGSYTTRSFSESQKFLVLDPSTGTTSLVLGSSLIDYIAPRLNSVIAESTRLAAENTDYDVGTIIQTSGDTAPGDNFAGTFLVVAGGEGDFPMINGNDLLIIKGDVLLREQLASSDVGEGSDLVAYTGTTDTVTEAMNNRVIRVSSRTEMKAYDVPAGYQFSLEEGGRSGLFVVKAGTPPSDPQEGIYVVLDNGNYAERIFSGDKVFSEWFGFQSSGSVTDRTTAMNATIASGYPVKLVPGASYEVNALTQFSSLVLYSGGKASATIKLANGSDDNLFDCTGTLITKGVLVDQNYQNQTNRLKSAIRHTGTLMVAWDCKFQNSMFSAIHVVNAPLEYIELMRNDFVDMAEATGVQGEQTQAVNCRVTGTACRALVQNNVVSQTTVVDADAAPGGFIFDVTDELTESFAKADFLYNKGFNIGQRKNFGAGTHFIGFIDFYTNCRESNVVGNEIEQYRYVPIKLQNSSRINCSGNIINGAFDASSGAAMVFQNARDSQQAIRSFTCHANQITLSGKTNDGIYIQGDPDGSGAFLTDRVNVFGNVIYGADNAIRCSFVPKANFSINSVELANVGYLFENTYPSGQVKYNINGGSVIDCDPRGVYLNGNGSNKPSLVVSGVTFEDNVSFHVDAINAANLTVTGCDMEGAPVDDIRAQTSDFVVVTGNNNGSITDNVNVPTGTLKQAGNSWS